MQHQQQQQEVGGGGHQPMGGYGGGTAADIVISDEDQKLGDLGIAEAASPISSRPPANFEEMIQATGEAGSSAGNRWPRQETLALLQIRSEMDAAFRDATLKGPLWEQVSRKLAELGYKRSAKKCKEKFENVQKYYKRTKEGRGGRQDGKSYKFFTQLEALNNSTAIAVQVPSVTVAPLPPPVLTPAATVSLPLPDLAGPSTHQGSAVPLFGSIGVSFSSNSSSSSEDDEHEDEIEMESTGDKRKRKRSSHGGGDSDERMMDFLDGLLRQVMQKQEAMQQKFLEAIEKREQDRMIREEAWKRQDMARIAREHDLMAQERAISASRDAAIITFLEKITGQTIHLPTAVPQNSPPPPTVFATTTAVPPPPPTTNAPPPPPTSAAPPPPTTFAQPERQNPHNQPQSMEIVEPHQLQNTTTDIVAAVPERQIPLQDSTAGSGGLEISSSRWPKAEVLALIQLRSGMESRYQDAGPKGPLWEEISAGMQRMGYNRNAKRCKEKWENINKYYKKVKESNKKRPEDSKTCPYFHELDALYRKKVLGNASGNVVGAGTPTLHSLPGSVSVDEGGSEAKTSGGGAFPATPLGEHRQGDFAGEKQPEDLLKKQLQQNYDGDTTIDNCSNGINFSNMDDLDQENDEDNYEEDDDENEDYDEEQRKMVYEIQYQRPSSNGANGTAPSSFLAMVQ